MVIRVNNIFKNKKVGLLATIIMFIFSALCIVGLSFALRNATLESDTINTISVGTINGKITEEYTEPNNLTPGSEVKKVVNVENTGSIPALVRASFTKECGYSRDDNGNIVKDSRIDTSKILINVDENSWIDGEDGYYYYKEVLEAGATTNNPLFKKYTISKNAGNEYRNAKCDIIVSTNIIEATKNSLPTLWGKTYRTLNMDVPSDNQRLEDTEVTFISPDEKFNIDVNKIDLFNNFKNLTPGVSRTQVIKVTNAYSNKQEIYLRAENTSQDSSNIEKINTLLKRYATITIKNDGNIIYEGPIWGNLDKDSDTMKNNISLGEFAATGSKNLVVTLSVSQEMSDEYQGLIGNVKWVFGTYDNSTSVKVHHYLENTTVPISPDVNISGNIGETYATTPVNDDDYELVSIPENASGTFTEQPIDVIYYYRLKNPVFESKPSVTKTATEVLTNINDYIDYRINYTATLSKYKGDINVKIVDTLPAKIKVNESQLDGGTYDASTNTITWNVPYQNINTYLNGNKVLNVSKHVKVKYESYEGVTNILNTVRSTTSFTGNYSPIVNDDSADTSVDLKGRLIVQYLVEGTDYKLYDDDITDDDIGKTYHAEPITIDGYELVDQTDNTTGKYKLEDTIVKFYYKLSDPVFENGPEIKKTGTSRLEYASDFVNYTIKYNATLSIYVGGVTVTIVDTLPGKIDSNTANLDGGVYNSDKNTITWTENIDNINTLENGKKTIEITKNIKVKYLDLKDISELENNVKSITSFSTNHPPVENTGSYTTEVDLKGKVITRYLNYGTDIVLSPEDVSEDKVGKSYETTEKQLEGYVLVEKPDNATGVYTIDDTIVTYYYRKVTDVKDGITKVGPVNQVNSVRSFTYNISYNGKVTEYVGDAKLTIIDYVPYEIDLGQSDIGTGVYDKSKKTITWEIPYDNIDARNKSYDIKQSFDITLFFKDYHNVSKLENKVKYVLQTDKTTTGEDTVITNLYKVKSKVIINHYVYGTKKKLVPSKVLLGYSGDKYKSTAKRSLLLKGYKLKYVEGDQKGIFKDIPTNVDYYYIVNENNPYTGDNITVYIIALGSVIVISSLVIFYVRSSRKKSKI